MKQREEKFKEVNNEKRTTEDRYEELCSTFKKMHVKGERETKEDRRTAED